MNEVALRIAIAQACGWREIHGGPPDGVCWRGINPARPRGLMEEIPDYCNDLNAMAEAESLLTDDEKPFYALFSTALGRAAVFMQILEGRAKQ